MLDFQNRKVGRRWFYSLPVLGALFLAALFLGQAALKAYLRSRAATAVYSEVRNNRQEIIARKNDLGKRLDYLSTAYGLEKELRRQFGLVKKGEGLATIIDRPRPTPLGENAGFKSFFSEMGNFLKGLFNPGP